MLGCHAKSSKTILIMTPSTSLQSPAPFVVTGPSDGRTAAPLNVVGEEVLVKVSGTDSNGEIAFFHLVAPPMSGPPLHFHTREDEVFYVLEGELIFQIDERRIVAVAGTTIYLRRGTRHAYQNFGNRPVRLLIAVTPAGLDRFFVELSARTGEASLPDLALVEELDVKYGLKTIGPPLSQ